MFEIILATSLLSPVEISERINMFCSEVVGITYASDNFSDEEWERFVYCREHIRGPK